MSVSLVDKDTSVKVSSSLNKSTGKKHLVDGSPETCWTSQQGSPQFVQLNFINPVIPKKISLTFQGGFVGSKCALWVSQNEGVWSAWTNLYPEDANRQQIFDLPDRTDPIAGLKLVFEESSDFFGRITIYDLKIHGTKEGS